MGTDEAAMQHHQNYFTGYQGLTLYYQAWQPDPEPIAVVVIVHGFGGHSGLFGNAVKVLNPRRIAVYALDMRGHGRSPGQRGFIHSWKEFREDLRAFITHVQATHPTVPCFLWGHSLGGAIAIDYGLHYPDGLQGLIATAPALGMIGVSPLRLKVGQLLSRIWPRFTLTSGMNDDLGARDPEVNQAYATDPLRHKEGSARLATEYLATIAHLEARASDLHVPLLIQHGECDIVTSPDSSAQFFARVIEEDKKYLNYPNAYHELHEDFNHEEVLADLANWLEAHLPTHFSPSSE